MAITFSRSIGITLGIIPTFALGQVALQNATATFSQAFDGPWLASQMIDGDYSNRNGWAVFDSTTNSTSPQTAVFETVADLNSPMLSIDMFHNFQTFVGHNVGRFRWSATTDDRSNFADGLQSGGDVTANWTVLTPVSVAQPVSMSSSILGDGSVLMSGTPVLGKYTVNLNLGLSNVTGLRLEVLDDPSLPTNGPGMYSTNGNFVLTEVNVQAVPEPATLVGVAAGLALLARRRRKKA